MGTGPRYLQGMVRKCASQYEVASKDAEQERSHEEKVQNSCEGDAFFAALFFGRSEF